MVDAEPDRDHDARLVVRMNGGDEAALGELYDRHGRKAYSIALAILRDPSDAEDAVAQAFVQLWQQGRRFDPARGGLSTWVGTVVRSRALDLYRATRRRQQAHDAALRSPDSWRWQPAHQETDVGRRELSGAVSAALREIPREQRVTIELAYFQGMSQSEIARATGTPLGTVKTRMRAAMQKLRGALGEHLRQDQR